MDWHRKGDDSGIFRDAIYVAGAGNLEQMINNIQLTDNGDVYTPNEENIIRLMEVCFNQNKALKSLMYENTRELDKIFVDCQAYKESTDKNYKSLQKEFEIEQQKCKSYEDQLCAPNLQKKKRSLEIQSANLENIQTKDLEKEDAAIIDKLVKDTFETIENTFNIEDKKSSLCIIKYEAGKSNLRSEKAKHTLKEFIGIQESMIQELSCPIVVLPQPSNYNFYELKASNEELVKQNEQLLTGLEELQTMKKELEKVNSKCESLIGQLNEKEDRIKSLEYEVNEKSFELMSVPNDNNKRMKDLEDLNYQLKKKINSLQQDLNETSNSNDKLDSKIDELEEVVENYKKKIKTVQYSKQTQEAKDSGRIETLEKWKRKVKNIYPDIEKTIITAEDTAPLDEVLHLQSPGSLLNESFSMIGNSLVADHSAVEQDDTRRMFNELKTNQNILSEVLNEFEVEVFSFANIDGNLKERVVQLITYYKEHTDTLTTLFEEEKRMHKLSLEEHAQQTSIDYQSKADVLNKKLEKSKQDYNELWESHKRKLKEQENGFVVHIESMRSELHGILATKEQDLQSAIGVKDQELQQYKIHYQELQEQMKQRNNLQDDVAALKFQADIYKNDFQVEREAREKQQAELLETRENLSKMEAENKALSLELNRMSSQRINDLHQRAYNTHQPDFQSLQELQRGNSRANRRSLANDENIFGRVNPPQNMRNAHAIQEHNCPKCNQPFPDSETLQIHLLACLDH